MRLWKQLRSYGGLLVLLAAIGFSVVSVAYRHLMYEAPGVRTIRLCHWQLESGFRGALDELIKEYEALYYKRTGKRLRVVQIPVSERGYEQFVNTGLIGGTAPDIIEKGKAKTAMDPAYVARFYLPLSAYLDEPNPYNEGTALEGRRWRDTFVDGMSSCYDYGLGDYYYIPFSMFTMRIYYNADLFRAATGQDQPPSSYSAFVEACRRIEAYGDRQGTPITPIAGSRLQLIMFRLNFERTFDYVMIPLADDNANSYSDPFETYHAYRKGQWNFFSPPLQAAWQCMAEIAGFFQPGWLAAQRDDAVFMFAQERAAMYASGSWDASSIIDQVKDRFRVGVMDFPLPTDHPTYGQYVLGPVSEGNISGGIPWAINSRSKHADQAIDFLRFATTRRNNARFNNAITWIPVVRGAKLSKRLEPFRPRLKGFHGSFNYNISSEVRIIGEGSRWTLYSGDISPEEYARRLTDVYERSAREGYLEMLDNQRRRGRDTQRLLAVLQVQSLRATPKQQAGLEDKALHVLNSIQGITNSVRYNAAQFATLDAAAKPSGEEQQ
jgi:raffinose/stachyose/melibiose transport system substrate-binding protein